MKFYVIVAEDMYYTHTTIDKDYKRANYHGVRDPHYAANYSTLSVASNVMSDLARLFHSLKFNLECIEQVEE